MVASAKLSANLKVVAYDFDPDESAVTDIGFIDLTNYETFMAIFVRSVGTGALETFNIIAILAYSTVSADFFSVISSHNA